MREMIRQKLAREFSQKRQRALMDAEQRKKALYIACPALGELDIAAAQASADHFKARLHGKDDEAEYEKTMVQISKRRAELMQGADVEPHFECTVCNDTGKVTGGYCKCFLSRVIEENLADANLSVSSANERFDNFDIGYYDDKPTVGDTTPRMVMEKILRRCKRFVAEFETDDKNLLMMGKSGLGKTFLSSAIAHELLQRGYTVIYISAGEFAARVQANKFGDRPEELQQYYDADLLILDDLGAEFKTQLTSSVLGEVIDRRLRSGKKMIFSTNLTTKELESNYSARIVSRFLGYFDLLYFIGKDIRRQRSGL